MNFSQDRVDEMFMAKQFDRIKDVCPNCDTMASIKMQREQMVWPELFHGGLPSTRVMEQVWECDHCDQTIVLLLHRTEDGSTTAHQVWPESPPRQFPSEAPEVVRSLYREASLAEAAGALRGAAALYRAAAEKLVEDQAVTGRSLEDRIDALADKGVDADIITDLHEARLTGNWSIHEGMEFSAEELDDVARLISDAVEILYVQPVRKEQMRAARQARRQQRQPEDLARGRWLDDRLGQWTRLAGPERRGESLPRTSGTNGDRGKC